MILQGRNKYRVQEVALHTAALEDPGAFFAAHPTPISARDEIDRWHRLRGWKNGFGYHGLFMPDGAFIEGRPFTQIGAHILGQNPGKLGFVMLNVRPHDGVTQFEDYFTKAQRKAVRAKIREVSKMTDLRRVTGHNDYTDLKECPGFKVKSSEWMPQAGPMDWLRAFLSRFRPIGA